MCGSRAFSRFAVVPCPKSIWPSSVHQRETKVCSWLSRLKIPFPRDSCCPKCYRCKLLQQLSHTSTSTVSMQGLLYTWKNFSIQQSLIEHFHSTLSSLTVFPGYRHEMLLLWPIGVVIYLKQISYFILHEQAEPRVQAYEWLCSNRGIDLENAQFGLAKSKKASFQTESWYNRNPVVMDWTVSFSCL